AHWRERFLGHPDEFPQRYEACSLILAAPKLTRPLLLMHGLEDTNVHPANTLRLSSALLAAGRPHEVLLLPGVGHQALGAAITENLLWHQVRFLQRHLVSGYAGSMTARPIVPDTFAVPEAHVTAGLRLELLGPQHNEADHAAWTSSIEHIRSTPGFEGDWPPTAGMTLAENLADL